MYMLLIEGTCAPKSMPKAAGVMLGVGDRLGRLYWVQLARSCDQAGIAKLNVTTFDD